MTALPWFFRPALVAKSGVKARFGSFSGAFVLVILAASLCASGQTATISGKVFDPRTTASALPLPNVLVYVTTYPVSPLPIGVQCLTYSSPADAVSYTNTGVDGSFTLKSVPVNTAYTLVIQAGKWRRQFPVKVDLTPLAGLNLHMPSNHLEGDVPMIAIATGAADGVECVLHDMGIADSEFTDDNGTRNSGGHIHLYRGSSSSGAVISPSTPVDTALTENSATLNSYDMVMFPCQGFPDGQTNQALSNVVGFANAGGRIFGTHFSYVWLDPNYPYNSQFPPVANWNPTFTTLQPDPGTATINTDFTDGATLSKWLENAGAAYNGEPGQVQISTLRHDIDSVIPPTQQWLTLNNPALNNPVMQITFNTPVGAPAAQQCGRVLFSEYHVMNLNGQGMSYPSECPGGKMSAQEEMLEYALFDLSAFVHPVVVPTLSIAFNPSPLVVKQSDTGDQVTISVVNSSTEPAVDASAELAITLPQPLVASAIVDPTQGWNCTLSTLKCTRTTSIPSGVTDSITLTVNVGTYPAKSSTSAIKVVVTSPTFSNDVTALDTVIFQQTPKISWAAPAPIIYGTALSEVQLDAKAVTPGTIAYTPAIGTVLPVGQQTLTAVFTPADETDFTTATATVNLTVVPATPIIAATPSPNPAFFSNAVTIIALIPSAAGMPGGTVTFFDGETQLGSAAVTGGSATLSTSALMVGRHNIMAAYSGDANYHPATTITSPEIIQDFAIAATPESGTGTPIVNPGSSATYSFVVSPIGGATMPAALALSVAGIPPTAIVEFSPSVVQANAGATTVTMVVHTPNLAGADPGRSPLRKGVLPMALGMLLLPFARRIRRSRRWIQMLLLSVAGGALTLGMTACGGITYTTRTFSMTVKAQSGNLAHTASVKLNVK